MTKSRNIKLKALMAKWLFISTIVVSLFAPTGSVGQSVLQAQKARIEFVFSNNAKPNCRTVTYQIRAAQAHSQSIYGTGLLYVHHLSAYGRLSKVKFDQLSRQAICINNGYRFYHLKVIPQGQSEDITDCFIA
jgi:hypothetical protein